MKRHCLRSSVKSISWLKRVGAAPLDKALTYFAGHSTHWVTAWTALLIEGEWHQTAALRLIRRVALSDRCFGIVVITSRGDGRCQLLPAAKELDIPSCTLELSVVVTRDDSRLGYIGGECCVSTATGGGLFNTRLISYGGK